MSILKSGLTGNPHCGRPVPVVGPSHNIVTSVATATVRHWVGYQVSRRSVLLLSRKGDANAATVAYDLGNNINDRIAAVTGLMPDVIGESMIGIGSTENNTNANHFTCLDVMKVEPTAD